MFVTFEGVEGSGKSTALAAVAARLADEGVDVLCTREPGGSGLGKKLRRLLLDEKSCIAPLAELHLFLADRAQHVEEVIRPALAAGKVVLCDRFMDSTVAYQGFARSFDIVLLDRLNSTATGGLKPDLTLILDLAPEEGLKRVAKRRQETGDLGEGRIDQETLDFHCRVRRGFHFIAERAASRVKVIDAALAREDVAQACYAAIRGRLSPERKAR